MKKAAAMILASLTALSLVACGSQSAQSSASSGTAQSSETSVQDETTSADTSVSDETETSGESQNTSDEKVLIVYFTPANSDGTTDVVSSATPRVGDTASVEYIADLIGQKVDADTAKIIPEEAYPTVYEKAADQAKDERDDNARPAFTIDVNPEDYDVVFVGYPIWWGQLPMIMETFFDTYDFSWKTIIPFNTHQGSRDAGTYDDIAELEPDATVLDGFNVNGQNAGDAENDVDKWLTGLGY